MKTPKILFAAVLLLLPVTSALAHGMQLSVRADGATVRGTVSYSDGEPAAGEWIQMFDLTRPATAPQQTNTAVDGNFSFPGIAGREYRIEVTGQESHSLEKRLILPTD